MQGWIKVHRKVTEHWLYSAEPYDKFHAWMDLLLLCNRSPAKMMIDGKLMDVDSGELVTSIRFLCDRWKWSNTKVKRYLDTLQADGMLSVKSDSKKTRLRVLHYAKYQAYGNAKNDTETTQERHRNDTETPQKHTNKNVEECRRNTGEGRERASACTPAKLYGEFKNVRLTDEEYAKLKKQFPLDWQRLIKNLSFHIHNTHKTYYDHFSVLEKWGAEDRKNSGALQSPPSYDLEQIKRDTMNNTDIKF
jgi:hypothetical protein